MAILICVLFFWDSSSPRPSKVCLRSSCTIPTLLISLAWAPGLHFGSGSTAHLTASNAFSWTCKMFYQYKKVQLTFGCLFCGLKKQQEKKKYIRKGEKTQHNSKIEEYFLHTHENSKSKYESAINIWAAMPGSPATSNTAGAHSQGNWIKMFKGWFCFSVKKLKALCSILLVDRV